MSVANYLRPEKQRVQIMTVDPSTRRVEATLKDGAMIQVAVWEVPALFRWPKEGEFWTVTRQKGVWMLDAIMEDQEASHKIEDTPSGGVKIQSDVIKTESGRDVVSADQAGATEGQSLSWTTQNGGQWVTGAPEHPDMLQRGVLNSGDLALSTVSGGTQIAAGVIYISDVAGALARHILGVPWTSGTHPGNNSGGPRVDSIIATFAGWNRTPSFSIVQGTATSGATLDNRAGAPTAAVYQVILRDILVNAGSPAGTFSGVRDRRPWARGAKVWMPLRTSGNYIAGTGFLTEVDTTNLKRRIECSGAPLRLSFNGSGDTQTATNGGYPPEFTFFRDGAEPATYNDSYRGAYYWGTDAWQVDWQIVDYSPLVGSHTFSLAWQGFGAGTKMYANSVRDLVKGVLIWEDLSLSSTAHNGTT